MSWPPSTSRSRSRKRLTISVLCVSSVYVCIEPRWLPHAIGDELKRRHIPTATAIQTTLHDRSCRLPPTFEQSSASEVPAYLQDDATEPATVVPATPAATTGEQVDEFGCAYFIVLFLLYCILSHACEHSCKF